MVVSPTGQVQDDLDYYPFGTVIPKQSTSGNNYQFTGYETDTESQTEHAWFRNLNPNLGRYMRPDPYEGSYVPYDPQSMNRYSYVGNRPLIFMDQYGLSCVTFDDGSMGDDGDGNGCAAAFIDPDGTDEDMEVVNVDGGAWGDDGNGGPWGGTIYGAIGPGGASGGGGGGLNCRGGNLSLGVGGQADFGVGSSATSISGSTSVGGAVDSNGPSGTASATGGITVPGSGGYVYGAYAGGGAVVTIGNAGGAGALRGPATTYFANAGFALLDVGVSLSFGQNGTWQLQVTPPVGSYGAGASLGKVTTNTAAVSTGGCN